MNCRACGRALLPFHEACFQCGATFQSAEAAAARKREWDALTPKVQEEMKGDYENQLQQRERWLEWLRENRRSHAACGAALYGIPSALIFAMLGGFPFWTLIPIGLFNLGLGAGLGFLLNQLRGGPYRGMGLFAGAFIVESVLRIGGASAAGIGVAFAGVALVVISGFLFFLCTGYAFGLQLTLERSDVGA